MHTLGLPGRLRELVLDATFVILVAHFLATGHVVPPALVELFRDQPQVVVISPIDSTPETAPASNDSLGETPGT
jgi:hypothetical protein